MNTFRIPLTFLFALILVGKATILSAQALNQVECPEIVANADDGMFAVIGEKQRGKYRCFSRAKHAKKAGFKSQAEGKSYDFTGWYRLNLSKVLKDTCSATPLTGGGTFFLQLRQSEGGIAAQFCPTIGTYTGYRSSSGLFLSTDEEFDSISGIDFCNGAPIKKQQFVELQQVVKGSTPFTAKYRTLYRCIGGESSGLTCLREFSGIAFLETHTIWPPVADNIDEQAGLCEVARTRCRECHTFLD